MSATQHGGVGCHLLIASLDMAPFPQTWLNSESEAPVCHYDSNQGARNPDLGVRHKGHELFERFNCLRRHHCLVSAAKFGEGL